MIQRSGYYLLFADYWTSIPDLPKKLSFESCYRLQDIGCRFSEVRQLFPLVLHIAYHLLQRIPSLAIVLLQIS